MFLSRQGARFASRNIHCCRGCTINTFLPSMTVGFRRNFSSSLKESYDNIIVEKPEEGNGKVAVIKLHRPKAMNALNDDLFEDLIHATRVLDKDQNIRCMVLTGSTPRCFAAGADISEMKDRKFEEVYRTDMFSEWQEVSKLGGTPIIAAVSGYCLGGGNELAMMCDIVVCARGAKFGQPEINLGIIPGAGGTQRLTRAIGKSKAMHMCLTGDLMDCQEAYASGLVAKVYDEEKLLEESIKMATKIASKGSASLRAVKEAVNAADELSLQEGLRFERRLFHALFATDDQTEGMAAFLEKRPPNFK